MADQATASSSTTARKRHKPIVPPSPEARQNSSPSNDKIHQRPSLYQSTTTTRDSGLGGARMRQYADRPLDDLISQDMEQSQGRMKASVFERLGGSTVSPAKRPNPCIKWLNTGTCSRGPQCPYLHPPLSPENSSTEPPIRSPRHNQQSKQDYQQQRSRTTTGDRRGRREQHRQRTSYPRDQEFGNGDEESPLARSSATNAYGSRSGLGPREDGYGREQRRQDGAGHIRDQYKHSPSFDVGERNQRRNRTDIDQDAQYVASECSADDLELSDYENSKLRSKVVITNSKPAEEKNGAIANISKRDSHIPRDAVAGDDNREQESEEALDLRLKELQRQLKELEEGKDAEEEQPTARGNCGSRKASDKGSSSKQSGRSRNKNGIISEKRYGNIDDQAALHNALPTSAVSSKASLHPTGRHGRRDEWRHPVDGVRKGHNDAASVKTYGSLSRRLKSPSGVGSIKHMNGERLGNAISDWPKGEKHRSPSAETSASKRSRRSVGEIQHREMPRHHVSALSASGPTGGNAYRHGDEHSRRLSSPFRHRREHGHDGNSDARRSVADMAGDRSHGFRSTPQHQEHSRRMPDKFYDRTDDRGNHSKSRTSTAIRNEPREMQPRSRQTSKYPISTSSNRPHSRGDEPRTSLRAPSTNVVASAAVERRRRRPTSTKSGALSRLQSPRSRGPTSVSHRQPDAPKGGSLSRKRPASELEAGRRGGNSGTTAKKGKYDGEDAEKRKRRHGTSRPSAMTLAKSEDGDKKRAKVEKEPETERPKEIPPALAQRELEPISDEEVEETSGELSPAAPVDGTVQNEAPAESSTSKIDERKKIENALSVEWAEVLPENTVIKPTISSGRRRCFDATYFLPTIALCADYLDERTLEEATSAADDRKGGDMDATMKKDAEEKRLRLLSDVGSTFRRAMSARVDLKIRRQLCGLAAETDVTRSTMELNVPSNGRTFRKALDFFEKAAKDAEVDSDAAERDAASIGDHFRTRL